MSKKFKRFKRNQIFVLSEELKSLRFHNPDLLNKYFICCDFGVAGKDESVECFVKRDGSKFKVSQDCDSEIMDRFRKEYGLNSKNISGLYEFNTQKIQESIDKCVNLLKESVKLSDELKKKKAMKITEETKLKDLIPEGYELDSDMSKKLFGHLDCDSNIFIILKKKEVKDFKWYWNEYSKTGLLRNFEGVCIEFETKHYDNIPFEIKIGLLKFICDGLDLVYLEYIQHLGNGWGLDKFKKLKDICPPEFLNSIFK